MEFISPRSIKVMPQSASAQSSDTYRLSSEEFQFYNEKGYLVIKELIDFASLYSYKQHFSRIAKGLVSGEFVIVKEQSLMHAGVQGEDLINKVQEILYDEVFSTYTENPRVLEVVSQFIGDNIRAMHSMFINKPPGSERHPAHQDLNYFPFRPAEKIIGVWTAIDHATVDNGCLYAVPGSHKAQTLYRHEERPKSNTLYHGVYNEDIIASRDKVIPLEMGPGDTVLLHPLLVHGSGPNVTKRYRKCISCHYASADCHYIETRGTAMEEIAKNIEEIMAKRGFQDATYVDFWKMKSKMVRGVQSNL